MWYRSVVTAEKHTSVIVALWLPSEKAKKLALKDSDITDDSKVEKASSLHLTLLYIGKADALKDKKDLIMAALESMANKHAKIKGKISGIGCFSGDGETKPLYASYDAPELPSIREDLVNTIESLGIELDKTHGFTPHITLAYLKAEDELPNVDIPDMVLEFDKFTLAWAGEQTHYDFSQN